MRMELHRVPDDVGDFDEPAVVVLVQCPKKAPLHGLQAVGEIRNGAVADDITGIFEKTPVHAAMQTAVGFFRVKRDVRNGSGHVLGENMRRAVAVGGGGFLHDLLIC